MSEGTSSCAVSLCCICRCAASAEACDRARARQFGPRLRRSTLCASPAAAGVWEAPAEGMPCSPNCASLGFTVGRHMCITCRSPSQHPASLTLIPIHPFSRDCVSMLACLLISCTVVRGCKLPSCFCCSCPQVGDGALAGIAAGCPTLLALRADHCSKVTDVGVLALAESCSHLEVGLSCLLQTG